VETSVAYSVWQSPYNLRKDLRYAIGAIIKAPRNAVRRVPVRCVQSSPIGEVMLQEHGTLLSYRGHQSAGLNDVRLRVKHHSVPAGRASPQKMA